MADETLNRVWLLHGVNLDMLGRRDPEQYGTMTLAELEAFVAEEGRKRGLDVRPFQTNHEGVLVEKIHEIVREGAAAVMINPGAWTHYSYALRDALEMVAAPIAEVHLSAVDERETWRRQSVIADVASVRVNGKGAAGYAEALARLADLLRHGDES